MTWVHLLVYVLSASFVMMAVAMLLAYRRTGHYGLFMMGMTYGASGGLAVLLMHWWPLVLGYTLVWMLKLLGLDPDKEIQQQREREAAGAAEPPGDQKKK